MKLLDVFSVKENIEKEFSYGKSINLSQFNKEIEKIRQSIEKSVQSVNEIEKFQSSLGLERSFGKKDMSSSINKLVLVNLEKSGKDFVRKEISIKLDSVEIRKLGFREEISFVLFKKFKEKLNIEVLLKMVNFLRLRKERKQLVEMIRFYVQFQKKLFLFRYNFQLLGSYDDNFDGRIEELRLEELFFEVQIQIVQFMEVEVIFDLNDLEMVLMFSLEKRKSGRGKLGKDDGIVVFNLVVLVRDQYYVLERVLQGILKERQRILFIDFDRIGIILRRREDLVEFLKFSDFFIFVMIKIEFMDLEYEKVV